MDILCLWSLLALALLAAFGFPRSGDAWFALPERAFSRLAMRRGRAMLLVAACALLAGAGLAQFTRLPQPGIHDEFSYLLASDTFAHGRLTNPTHPMWVHFESMHLIQQPSYASKYPPGQGLALALGQKLGGHPILGVWLSTAFACATIYWMLLAWVPARWALLGGLLTAVNPPLLAWSQCYWGGAVAMAGGALVLGAFRRILDQPRTRDALWLGLGVAILANSRPFEGLILSLLIATALGVWMFRRSSPPARILFRKLVLPTGTVLALAGIWMGFYNYRVTGSPLKMPYSVHETAYSITPIFLWQKPKPEPAYNHSTIRDFQTGWSFSFYQRQQSVRGFATDCGRKLFTLGKWYFWSFAMLLPLLFSLRAARTDRWLRLTLLLALLFTVALFPLTWTVWPHYAAPAAGLFCLLTLQSLRHLCGWHWRGQPVGRSLARGLLLVCVAATLLFCRRQSKSNEGNFERAQLLADLQNRETPQLIVVRYGTKHSPHDEWVYNAADIDGAKVVWAREMDAAHNAKLLEYFKNRKVWLLEPDLKPLKLVPYP